jgi:hypothetical protein
MKISRGLVLMKPHDDGISNREEILLKPLDNSTINKPGFSIGVFLITIP